MKAQDIYVSLDIGTTSIKVVVAEYVDHQMNIIGVGHHRSKGLSRGVIVDIDETVFSIKQAVSQAEQKANITIKEVIVGVPSNQIAIEPCQGMVAVANENREIKNQDVLNVLEAAKIRSVAPEREIVSVVPEEFVVDGFEGIKDPRGMIGVRLEVYAHIITGPKTLVHNIRHCVEQAGLSIQDLVLQPLAIAQTAMSASEREFGTVLIDLGGGQSTASVIHDHQLKFAYVDQEGADFVTKDISIILNTSLDHAERIKIEYGHAIPANTSDEEYFSVETIGKKEPVKVDERYLADIIEARVMQIFETLKAALDDVRALDLPGGIVMTGGGAALSGIVDLAQDYFGVPVRYYIPKQVGMRNSIYATSIGLIQYAANLNEIYRIAQGNEVPEIKELPEEPHQKFVFVEATQQEPAEKKKQQTQKTMERSSILAQAQSKWHDWAPKVAQEKKKQDSPVVMKVKSFFKTFFE